MASNQNPDSALVPVSKAADDTTVIAPSTLTITHYQQLAAEFSAELDRVLSMFPATDPARSASEDFVRSRRSVPLVFMGTAIAGVQETPELQAIKKLDVNEGRDTLQFIDAFRPVIDKVDRFQKELAARMNVRQALLAEDSLQIYEVVKGLVRGKRSGPMATLAANLKRDLGIAEARRRTAAKVAAGKKAAEEEAAAAAAPSVAS
ncbi:MAG TPA: hypothetical protein VKB93_15320 [Thermoanaerobaculia bacterium]|nr:hypothetical protein [Thermoanaerobaculia bacterium]